MATPNGYSLALPHDQRVAAFAAPVVAVCSGESVDVRRLLALVATGEAVE